MKTSQNFQFFSYLSYWEKLQSNIDRGKTSVYKLERHSYWVRSKSQFYNSTQDVLKESTTILSMYQAQ